MGAKCLKDFNKFWMTDILPGDVQDGLPVQALGVQVASAVLEQLHEAPERVRRQAAISFQQDMEIRVFIAIRLHVQKQGDFGFAQVFADNLYLFFRHDQLPTCVTMVRRAWYHVRIDAPMRALPLWPLAGEPCRMARFALAF